MAMRAISRLFIPGLGAIGIAIILCLLLEIFLVIWSTLTDRPTAYVIDNIFHNRLYYQSLANTVVFAVIATAVAFLFGVPIAWLTERTDLPGRGAVCVLMTFGVFIPGFFNAMGWLFLAHPRIGILNAWFGDPGAPVINVASLVGMGMVQGTALATLA